MYPGTGSHPKLPATSRLTLIVDGRTVLGRHAEVVPRTERHALDVAMAFGEPAIAPGIAGRGRAVSIDAQHFAAERASSCGCVPIAASPVPTHRYPSGPKRGRHPLCLPVLYGMPVTMSVRPSTSPPLGVRA